MLSAELDYIDVYRLEEQKSGQSTILLETDQIVELPYSSNWVFFVNDLPFANWAHPCRYIFVDVLSGEYQTVYQNFFPPNWKISYTTISLMNRPSLQDLPVNPDAVTDELDPNPHLFAVIINPIEEENWLWYDVSAIYCTLLNYYGFTKENIFIHYDHGSSNISNDLDGNNVWDDIDYDAYESSISHTFEELSGESNTSPEIPKLGAADQLFIFIDGYGWIYNGHSYLILYNSDIIDYEMAGYLDNINCSQMIIMMQANEMGGFYSELSDYISYNVSCKNRFIQSTDLDGQTFLETWITGIYSEFVYYWTAAVRGYYLHNAYPWQNSYEVGHFVWEDYFPEYPEPGWHPADYNPDLNGDGYIQMLEAFDYANNWDTWSPPPDGGYYNPNDGGSVEHPQQFIDVSFFEDYETQDLLTLSGLAGHVVIGETVENRNYMIGGKFYIEPQVSLIFQDETNIYLGIKMQIS